MNYAGGTRPQHTGRQRRFTAVGSDKRDTPLCPNALRYPLRVVLTAGEQSNPIGARALLSDLPDAKHMLADRGYDAVEDPEITPPTRIPTAQMIGGLPRVIAS